MFNLDQAITEWRRQMAAGGVTTHEVLNELESHLREDVEQRMRSGLNAQQAFDTAVQRIGQAHALKAEFEKAGETPGAMRKLMGFVCVVFVGFIVWLSGYTFLEMELSLGEQILAYIAVAFTLTAAGGWRYVVPFLPVIPTKRKRIAVGCACILAGFLCTSLYCNVILPHFERDLGGQIPAIGFWAVLPIAVGFGLACGIQEAARRQSATVVS